MEEKEMGKIVGEEKRAEGEVKNEQPKEVVRSRERNGLVISLAIIAMVLGGGGLTLGWMAYEKASTPITFLSGGTDGNSANFTDGSIADIAEKVSAPP